jgi:CrcB protein
VVTALAFVLVAGAAAAVRWAARVALPTPAGLPLGTLVVNLVGAFVLGLVAGWSAPIGTVVATAGLGGLTTFSTFSSEIVHGWSSNRRVAVLYLAVTLVGGVGLAWIGLRLGS